MKQILLFLGITSFLLPACISQNLYLLPGTGSDARVFDKLELPKKYTVHHLAYSTPSPSMNLQKYAQHLAVQLDTTQPINLIGVSLGGMLAVEIAKQIEVENIIIIASAKSFEELPWQYRIQRKLKIHKLLSGKFYKHSAKLLQPLFEPDRDYDRSLFKAMISSKDPEFLKQAIRMMIEWESDIPLPELVHIHGTKDNTLPIKHIQADHSIEGGSHMMVYSRSEEINKILALELNN